MNHNDVLRRLLYALDLNDAGLIRLARLGGAELTLPELADCLTREDEPGFVPCPDRVLAAILDGLIVDRRGPRDPAAPAPPKEGRLDNNAILKKLRIALQLQQDDLLEVLRLGGMELSPSELSALFRNEKHKHYKPCGDQLLRNVLKGLTARLRPG